MTVPPTRTEERLKTLSYILCDGLSYSWFRCTELDDEACTATVHVDTGEYDDETGESIFEKHEVTANDVARGLRMVREYFNGERELYNGQWDYYRRMKGPDWTPNKGSKEDYLYQLILFDRTNGEEGDYDANTADMVMQYALLGEVRYG